ncbi:hypothetical protein OG21DRAFT_1484908 [Imleria badia]|nr:hypothetical protein OG21DRAFT_1484908 [Imleria badia]
MYKPVPTSNGTARGTSGFFISDPRHPGKIYLVTARHVVFHPDKEPNELYQHRYSGQRRTNVLLFGDAAIEKHITDIESEIDGKHIIIEQLKKRLKGAEQVDEEDAEAERNQVQLQLKEAREAIVALENYVVLSPPIGFGVGEERFTEDWAVIEIDSSKVDSTNFVGNAIDLGTTTPVDKFTAWMHPHHANPPSFEYPGNRLLEFYGTIPDKDIWNPSPKTLDHDNDPCIMVMKRGHASDLTDQSGQMSMEVAVLPRNSESGAFSKPGDSSSAVVDGKGRIAGLLTGGAGADSEAFDCTYVTSANFLIQRMSEHGLVTNLSPSLNA